MLKTLQREFIYLWYYFDVQFRQIFGYWVLGIVIGSVISVFAKDKIHGLFAKMNEKKVGRIWRDSRKYAWYCFTTLYVWNDPDCRIFCQ